MWRRLRHGRSIDSNGFLAQNSSAPAQVEERPSLPPYEPSSERPQQQTLPSWSLKVRTGVPPPAHHSSTLSDIHGQLYLPHQRQHSWDRRDDPLGLLVLHTPPERTVDIVFIHGLGGTSLQSWCRDKDLNKLWPKLWLPDDLPTARVLTFGYNAHFSSKKEQAASTIGDFANDLLFRMKYGESTPERLGQVPIIFVAHSMGGLVFKKAFVQGHLNPEFNEIVSMIKAVLFLATPHRGTDLAETLSKLLSTSFFGHSLKKYVTELARRSPTIDELNEAFRHHASKLQIFSFYETMTTTAGPMSLMIVDKSTAVMGYPNETTAPLAANHHDVCKFTSASDPNYASVVGALRSLASSICSPVGDAASKQDLQHVAELLGVAGPPEEDLALGRSAVKEGTCEGFLASEEVDSWLHSTSQRVLWVHAQPGGGKSTLCSFVIQRLLDDGHRCAYFFFKFGQRDKQSTSSMLRSLAYQTAHELPAFRRSLVDLARSGVRLSKADSGVVWDKVYSSMPGNLRTDKTIYWVIDGLDEAESSRRVVELLSRAAEFESHLHILVFSRALPSINQAFQLARRKISIADMPLPDNQQDIRLMVAEEIEYLLSGEDFKAKAVDEIVARSQGNFLWASLVTKQVVKCHREDEVRRVLESTPDGMHGLYDRMMDAIKNLETDEDKALAKKLLTWAMYSKTPVTVEELAEVYPAELGSIMNISHTASQVCGQFVVVNPEGRVTLVHHSAREYLRRTNCGPFALDPVYANEEILSKCLAILCDKGLRRKLQMLKVPQFLLYASTSWAAHLEESSPDSKQILDALVRFFSGPYPLAWIQYLAMSGRLSELFGASRRLTSYVRNRNQADSDKSPMLQRLTDLSLLETWAVDLMRLPTKFGRHLSESPALIYQCIPALSPASSIIHRKFGENPAATLSVSGLSNAEWDDCLARVSGGTGRALLVAASPLYLAVVSDEPRGTITVWETDLFEERRAFFLGEHIWALAFNNSGSLLACYASSRTHVWKVADWSLEISADNPRRERAIEFKFDENDSLMMVSDLRRVHRLHTRHSGQGPTIWERLDQGLLNEPGVPKGVFLGTPSSVAFNSDCTQIAVAYRSFPLSVWTVEPPRMVARLMKKTKHGRSPVISYTGTNKIVWHPSGTYILGIFGQILKWSPEDDTYEEAKRVTGVDPHELACSPDGRVFVTSDVQGYIKIYDFSSMSLIYKLSSEDRIEQILFSPDSNRFYDLRGSYCNVWEPNCLLRLADASPEQISDTDSAAEDDFWSATGESLGTPTSFPASESHVESKPAIMAVSSGRGPNGLFVATANSAGSISIYDAVGRRQYEIAKARFGTTANILAWSPKYDRLAHVLSGGATCVRSVGVDYASGRLLSTEVVYSEELSPTSRGLTRQLLFDGTGGRLLVCGTKACQVLSLPDGVVLAEHQLPHDDDKPEELKWHRHNTEPQHVLCFSASSVTVFSWNDLKPQISISLDLSNPDAKDDDPLPVTIDAILDSYSPRFLLLRTFTMVYNRRHYGFCVLPTTPICARTPSPSTSTSTPTEQDTSTSSTAIEIKPIPLPPALTSTIAHAIGILPDGRLVFLDRALWVCTTGLSPTDTTTPTTENPKPDVRRHFFVPHDWVTTQGLRLCRLLRDGAVLVPSKGEVAIMRGDLVIDF